MPLTPNDSIGVRNLGACGMDYLFDIARFQNLGWPSDQRRGLHHLNVLFQV